MKRIITFLAAICCSTLSFAQLNVSFVGSYDYTNELSDIWGYVAPDGTEYALVGVFNGVSIVNLSDPANPVENAFVSGANSGWRDIKTWGEFAYVINETGNGLAVIDLSDLPNSVTAYDWAPQIDGQTLSSCHNIYIDEFGYAYLSGCTMNNGGLLFVDVFSDPGNPIYVDKAPANYSHDVYVRDNLAYNSEIGSGVFTILDVTDKSNVVTLASQATPAGVTHNAWPSEDSNYLFTTDETGNAPVASYDISDPSNVQELDQFRPLETLGEGVIPHNVHVFQNWLIISYYTDGCIIVDSTDPENLIEVGNFDTFFPPSSGFNGAWGAYPFLPSGLILVSDIGDGLFILEPNYVQAAYLEGQITDATTSNPIVNADIRILGTNVEETSKLNGDYKTGYAIAGTYTVEVSAPLYETATASVILDNGTITIQDFALELLPSFSISGTVIDQFDGTPLADARVEISSTLANFSATTNSDGLYTLGGVVEDEYTIYAGVWGHKQAELTSQMISANNNSFDFELEKGIEDGFAVDLGWTINSNATQGEWERGVPIGVFESGAGFFITPNGESFLDIGNTCYVTQNTDNFVSGSIANGFTSLTSPYFDLTNFNEPIFKYYTWFISADPNNGNSGDGSMEISISNGTETVLLKEITEEPAGFVNAPLWSLNTHELTGIMTFTDSMQIIVEVLANSNNDITEAGLDFVQVYDNDPVSTANLNLQTSLDLSAFPNPSTTTFNINYTLTDVKETAYLTVYNILGQEIEQINLPKFLSGNISVGGDWKPGIYLAQISNGAEKGKAIRLIKK